MNRRRGHYTRWISIISTMFGLGLVVGGCPPQTQDSTDTDNGVTTHDVVIKDLAFDPREVTIHVGERVRWMNQESTQIAHSSTSGDPGAADEGLVWDSGTLLPAQEFTRPFDVRGTYTYHCRIHSATMRDGKVIVVP